MNHQFSHDVNEYPELDYIPNHPWHGISYNSTGVHNISSLIHDESYVERAELQRHENGEGDEKFSGSKQSNASNNITDNSNPLTQAKDDTSVALFDPDCEPRDESSW